MNRISSWEILGIVVKGQQFSPSNRHSNAGKSHDGQLRGSSIVGLLFRVSNLRPGLLLEMLVLRVLVISSPTRLVLAGLVTSSAG